MHCKKSVHHNGMLVEDGRASHVNAVEQADFHGQSELRGQKHKASISTQSQLLIDVAEGFEDKVK